MDCNRVSVTWEKENNLLITNFQEKSFSNNHSYFQFKVSNLLLYPDYVDFQDYKWSLWPEKSKTTIILSLQTLIYLENLPANTFNLYLNNWKMNLGFNKHLIRAYLIWIIIQPIQDGTSTQKSCHLPPYISNIRYMWGQRSKERWGKVVPVCTMPLHFYRQNYGKIIFPPTSY